MLQKTFRMLAGYNAWANERLYAAVGALPEADFVADRGLFFRSLMGTLNHLLVTDRIWLKRFTGQGEAPDRLDAILFPSFEPLAEARRAEDERIAAFVAGLSDSEREATFTYTRLADGLTYTQPLADALFHVFNHQTHHRGQCHAALTGLGAEAPSLDMVAFQRT